MPYYVLFMPDGRGAPGRELIMNIGPGANPVPGEALL